MMISICTINIENKALIWIYRCRTAGHSGFQDDDVYAAGFLCSGLVLHACTSLFYRW